MTTIKQVLQAIITLAENNDIPEAMAANNVLDAYCWENPDDSITDLINIFINSVMNQNYKKVERIVEYARNYLEDL